MNTRLQQFLSAENISQSQFADTIGVARASVSHILAGRNKPGFDFIENMSKRFPALNLEWLITGKGKMYKQKNDSQESVSLYDPSDLFSQPEPAPAPTQSPMETKIEPSIEIKPIDNKRQSVKNQRNITRIVVFYDDNTYQELR